MRTRLQPVRGSPAPGNSSPPGSIKRRRRSCAVGTTSAAPPPRSSAPAPLPGPVAQRIVPGAALPPRRRRRLRTTLTGARALARHPPPPRTILIPCSCPCRCAAPATTTSSRWRTLLATQTSEASRVRRARALAPLLRKSAGARSAHEWHTNGTPPCQPANPVRPSRPASTAAGYTINSSKVIFLRRRPQPRPPKGAVGASLCTVCSRHLQDVSRFCSLQCKLDSQAGVTHVSLRAVQVPTAADRAHSSGSSARSGSGPETPGHFSALRALDGGASSSDSECMCVLGRSRQWGGVCCPGRRWLEPGAAHSKPLRTACAWACPPRQLRLAQPQPAHLLHSPPCLAGPTSMAPLSSGGRAAPCVPPRCSRRQHSPTAFSRDHTLPRRHAHTAGPLVRVNSASARTACPSVPATVHHSRRLAPHYSVPRPLPH